jgi:nitronate monooxygenase
MSRTGLFNMVLIHSPVNLSHDYPRAASPLIFSAPMAKVAKPELAVAVSKAYGLGFIAVKYTNDNLEDLLEEAVGNIYVRCPL